MSRYTAAKARLKDKALTLDCSMTDIDQCTMVFGLVKFQRENGQILGFELDSGRVKNLVFSKNN